MSLVAVSGDFDNFIGDDKFVTKDGVTTKKSVLRKLYKCNRTGYEKFGTSLTTRDYREVSPLQYFFIVFYLYFIY